MLEAHGGNIYQYSHPVIDFSANINPLGVPPLIRKAIEEGIDALVHYPDPNYTALRTAIAGYCGLSDIENILVGNGATELIFLLFRAFHPRRVLAPVPLFSEYERAAQLAGADFIPLPLKWENNFTLSLSQIGKAMEDNIDMLVLCNPNNPTGQLLGIETVEAILEAAEKAGVVVVIDETFIEFTQDYPRSSVLTLSPRFKNLVVIRALTKFYALPGLRLGYAWVGKKELRQQYDQIREPWSVNALAAAAGQVAFLDNNYTSASRAWIRQEQDFMYLSLKSLADLTVFKPAANFILCKINCPHLNANLLRDKLLDDGILIRDASNFAALDTSFIRLAVKSAPDNQYLISCLQKYLD